MCWALISRLSRLLFARKYLAQNGYENVKLFTGDLDRIPLASASVDVVLTIHAVEPNRGREEAVLSELLRVARKHLVMIEPSYEFASAECARADGSARLCARIAVDPGKSWSSSASG